MVAKPKKKMGRPPKRPGVATMVVSHVLPTKMHRELKAWCALHGVTVTDQVEMLVGEFLERERLAAEGEE